MPFRVILYEIIFLTFGVNSIFAQVNVIGDQNFLFIQNNNEINLVLNLYFGRVQPHGQVVVYLALLANFQEIMRLVRMQLWIHSYLIYSLFIRIYKILH